MYPASIFPQSIFPAPVYPGAGRMAADLVEAAVAALRGDAALAAALAGGVWSDEAPPKTPLPYAVLVEGGDASDWDSYAALGRWQFRVSLFAASSKSAARALGRLAKAALKDADLSFASGELLYLRPGDSVCTKDPDKGPDGVDVWQCAVTFSAIEAEHP